MLDCNNTLIIAIDIQEKLVNMLKNGNFVASNCAKLLNAADILNIPAILSEQYPKGLGETIPLIKEIKNFTRIEKSTFSVFETLSLKEEIQKYKKENIVIFGIETHICLYQSVLDLLKEKYNVYVVCDCSSSRNEFNHKTALNLLEKEGAKLTSVEIVLFEFLKTSKHPNFKEVQALIK